MPSAILYCMSPVRLYHIFPHYLINYTIFGKRLLNIKYVLRSSLQILSAAVLILRRPSAAWSHMFIGLHVRYPLFLRYFNATGIFSADFRKILKYQISWKSVQWDSSSMRTDRQMDTMKLVVAFRNFANVPNYHESDSPLNLCCYVYTYITCIYVSMYIYIIYII